MTANQTQEEQATKVMGDCEALDETNCDSDITCAWCKCSAVPSKCYSQADAMKLPASIFSCNFDMTNSLNSIDK